MNSRMQLKAANKEVEIKRFNENSYTFILVTGREL